MREVYRIISFVFHPLVLPLYGFTILVLIVPTAFWFTPEPPVLLLRPLVMNMLFLPLFAVFLLQALGFVRSLYFTDRKERVILLMITMIFYWWNNWVFSSKAGVPEVMHLFSLGALIAVIASFVVTMVLFKVSLHSVGMGVLCGLVLSQVQTADVNVVMVLMGVIIVSGWVGTARLTISDHSGRDVYGGFLLGVASQLLAQVLIS
jgi:hypothetical protein